MRTVELLLAHPPYPKPRPRMVRSGHVYMPSAYETWRRAVALDAQEQFHGEPISGPIQVSILVAGPTRGRGDLESHAGSLMDTLGGDRHAKTPRPGIVFDDDDQIVVLEARFAEAPDWLLSVTIREVLAPDWEGAKKRRKQAEREAKKAAKRNAPAAQRTVDATKPGPSEDRPVGAAEEATK